MTFGEEKMKEILRDRDSVKVGHVQSLLESAGISTFIRNDTLSVTEVSIPDFFPAVCVVNDTDYEFAMALISDHFAKPESGEAAERICQHCGEKNPSLFGVCWNCQKPIDE